MAQAAGASQAAIPDVEEVALDSLRDRVARIAAAKMRFVTTTCLDAGDNVEIYYHFGDGETLLNLHVVAPKDATIPSISDLYFAAVLAENEMGEMFGLKLDGLALDYHGRMLLSEDVPPAPMLKTAGIGVTTQPLKPPTS